MGKKFNKIPPAVTEFIQMIEIFHDVCEAYKKEPTGIVPLREMTLFVKGICDEGRVACLALKEVNRKQIKLRKRVSTELTAEELRRTLL